MTESEDAWAEVARRVAMSRFSGITADDDDVLRGGEMTEAALNPNRQGGGAGGVGGPGMMPPMMMGGMGGGGGAAAGGGSGGGLGAGAVGGAAVGSKPPMATVGTGVQASQAPVAEPEEAEVPGLGGGGLGGGGLGGGDAGPAEPEVPAGAGGPGTAPADGFSADPAVLRTLAAKWAEVAQRLHGLEGPAADATLGLVVPPERPQQAVHQQVEQWTTGAASEFDAIVARLHDVAGQYDAVEESGVAEIRKKTADD